MHLAYIQTPPLVPLLLVAAQAVIFILALFQILTRSMPDTTKLLWVVVCLLIPLIGPILWFVIGARQNPR